MNDLDLRLEVVSRSCQPLRDIRRWISRKPLEIEAWFQRTTNRKWHMDYQIVTWSLTSCDPEGAVRQYTVGYPSDSLASCTLRWCANNCECIVGSRRLWSLWLVLSNVRSCGHYHYNAALPDYCLLLHMHFHAVNANTLPIHCVQKKNTNLHFVSYLHELFVDLNKNCSEYAQGLTDSDSVKIRYSLRSMT